MHDLIAAFDMVDHKSNSIITKCLQNTETCTWLVQKQFVAEEIQGQHRWQILQKRTLDYSVPQGSQGSSDLFVLYSVSLETVIPRGIGINDYADDHNFHKTFHTSSDGKEELKYTQDLENWTQKILVWMHENRLKMNP